MKLHKIMPNGMKIYTTNTDYVVKLDNEIVARFDEEQAAYAYCDDSTGETDETN